MTTMSSREDGWTVEAAIRDLRSRIQAGEFQESKKLPSASALGKQYGLSRNAMNKVLGELRREGLIETQSGARGATVRDWEPLAFLPQQEFEATTGPDADLLTRLVEADARKGESRIDSISVEAVEDRIRKKLQLGPHDDVAVRRRTSIVDGVPALLDDSYVPWRLVEGSDWMRKGSVARGTNAVLAELGYELDFAIDELRPRFTTPWENERLGLGAGPVHTIELVSTAFDQQDMPIQVTVLTLPGPRNTVAYRRRRPRREGTE
ncbi:GntR family transcriptional regulator [Streptomyces sp. NPDC053474]|uniref:GntR family transcriptional regulator n=1 Tax=Streptomyces sp. NPDC053474 TaxID=3365704 RepID=UPI0037D9541F